MKYLLNFIADLVFPPECLGCKNDGRYLCENCISKMNFQTKPFWISGVKVYACMDYNDPLVRKAIKLFKYKFVKQLVEILGEILLKNTLYFSKDTLLVPTPLSAKKLKFRGFNQSLLLANYLSKKCEIKVLDCLWREDAQEQAKLKRSERLKNLTNLFHLTESYSVAGKNIVIIDDIVTTGTTLKECERVLKANGAATVIGLVLAKS